MTTNLTIGSYTEQLASLPKEGKVLQAQYTSEYVVVYQAFSNAIADWAVEHNCFGGPDYSFTRMTWIKPNFTWMVSRRVRFISALSLSINHPLIVGLLLRKKKSKKQQIDHYNPPQ